jgi:hypothetical protein
MKNANAAESKPVCIGGLPAEQPLGGNLCAFFAV